MSKPEGASAEAFSTLCYRTAPPDSTTEFHTKAIMAGVVGHMLHERSTPNDNVTLANAAPTCNYSSQVYEAA